MVIYGDFLPLHTGIVEDLRHQEEVDTSDERSIMAEEVVSKAFETASRRYSQEL